MSMRDSAMRSSVTVCSAIGLPKATRVLTRLHIASSARSATPIDAHAVVDAAGAEASLRDLEAASLAEQHVRRRHAHVLEEHLAVAVRRVVVAEHRQMAHAPSRPACRAAPGSATAAGVGRVGIGLAHHDHDLAVRMQDARGPPLAAVDDVVVAVAPDLAAGCWWRRTTRRRARSWRRRSGSRRRAAARASALAARRCRSARSPPCCRCRARRS